MASSLSVCASLCSPPRHGRTGSQARGRLRSRLRVSGQKSSHLSSHGRFNCGNSASDLISLKSTCALFDPTFDAVLEFLSMAMATKTELAKARPSPCTFLSV